MTPTFRPGQVVLASGWRKLQPGSVVIADVGEREVLKRVSGINGSKLELVSDNTAGSSYSNVDMSAVQGVVL